MRTLIAMTALLALTACRTDSGPGVCVRPADPMPAGLSDGDWLRRDAEYCIHRTAYELAVSDFDAATVAQAVVGECEAKIARSTAQTRSDAVSRNLVEGATLDERNRMAEKAVKAADDLFVSFALVKIAQGRAGGCKA